MGGGLKASNLATTESESGNIFYVEEGKNFELEKITLDGDKKARIIYSNGGILKITNSTIKNGYPGANAKANPGGGIFLKGGSLEAKDTNFIGNTPGTNTTLPKGDGDLNGGAIYSGSTKADITITGGKFENNEVKAYGHGAAIYQENGILNVTGTSFKNNKGHVEGGNAGTQGACIHTRDKVKATISGVTAEIAKGFNTGGFLRSWKSDVTVTDSKFTINGLGDGYGYSGGALCFEGGTSKVTGSTFTCNGSKLYHAGGFIDIVGGGTHIIDTNTMTGAGKENGQQIASFGGAISVEEGANATVTIKDNTITGASASDNGGAIAIGTHKGKSTPSTVTMSGNTISNAGTLFWGAQYGGGVFVAPDATVTMTKDTIKDTRSSYGGGVYNEGKLTITGGSSLTGGVGSKLGGEIYNNGDLTVDDATITGNFVGGAVWQQYASHGKNFELGGTNIYAEKDVTITPKANITTGKDVRVLDGQSKILLTGPLTKEIDVSVSEVAGGNETQKRRVGYVVAAGKDGYVATKSDAKFLHYIGRTNKEDASHYSNQPRAAFADDKSTGEWDFVLDKDNKKVVLGQRVKLIYHGNLGKLGGNDSAEKTVDVYKNPNFWEGQLEEYQVADPTLDGSSFMGWYFWKSGDSVEDTDDSIQSIKIPDDLRKKLFDFSRVTFQNNKEDTDQIITPNIIHTYAGWSQNISIPVFKEWADAKDNDKVDVTVTLKGGDEDKTVTLTKARNYFDQFEDLKVFTKSYEPNKEKNMNLKFTPREYKVEETPIDGFTTSYSPQSMKANEVAEVSRFVVTNKKTFKVTYEFKSGTEGKTLPAEINGYKPTDDAEYADGATVNAKEPTKTSYEAEDGTWTFTKWDTNSKTIDGADVKFIGTWIFTPKAPEPETKYKVTYEFVSETEGKTLPAEINGYKPTDDAEYADGATVNAKEPTQTSYEAEDGTWTFTKWDANSKTIDGADVKFIGTWTFTPKAPEPETKYKVTYEFKSGTEEKTLPAEVEGYKPADDAKYADGATVNAKEPTETSYESEDGTWTFTKWDANSKTIDGADVKFIGTWTFTPKAPEPETKYKVTYEFVSGTEGKTLPAEVEGYKPTDDAEYADGVTVNAKEPTETSYEAEDGTWTFTKWDANSKTIDGADVKFIGTWTFTPKEKPNPDKPKPPVTNIITEYVDIYGNELIPSKDGDQPVEVIPGYEFIETRRTEKVVSHIYKKIEREDPNPWFPLFPRVERKEKVETISVNAVVPEKTLLNKEDHKAYMFGYPDWTFLPNNNMTRAEVTAMFARLLKNYPSTNVKYNLPYSDVFEGDWYYPAVGFMTENNIIKGYEDGTFRPNAPITRAEFATIASKFDEIIGGDVKGFYDVPASHWALKYINSAYERGWVTGYEDGSFRPDRFITRAEVVTVTNKMLIRYADVDYVRAHRDLLINFKDLDESHWAYFNIMEATHGHDFMRKANGKDETWERLNGEAFIFPDLRYEER